MFIRDLLERLAQERVPYCLVGGVAVNLHGIPRMTYDVDLVVEPTVAALEALDALLGAMGLRPRLPLRLVELADAAHRRQLLEERNLIAVTYTDPSDPLREVDILVSPPVEPGDVVRRAVTLDLGGVPVQIACIDDLIAMKRASGRAQDLADAAHLDRLRQDGGDG